MYVFNIFYAKSIRKNCKPYVLMLQVKILNKSNRYKLKITIRRDLAIYFLVINQRFCNFYHFERCERFYNNG